MSEKKILLTQAGLAELGEELRFLREEKRVDIASKLKEAISYGDLSENAEYQEARDEQAQVELRIAELEEMLKPGNYDIIEDDRGGKKRKVGINVGSTVTISEVGTKESLTYVIVGSQEANILENKISNESPLGKSLIGKNPGDTATMNAPSGQKEYTIVDVK
jgi:transcription elongation factor GreA